MTTVVGAKWAEKEVYEHITHFQAWESISRLDVNQINQMQTLHEHGCFQIKSN